MKLRWYRLRKWLFKSSSDNFDRIEKEVKVLTMWTVWLGLRTCGWIERRSGCCSGPGESTNVDGSVGPTEWIGFRWHPGNWEKNGVQSFFCRAYTKLSIHEILDMHPYFSSVWTKIVLNYFKWFYENDRKIKYECLVWYCSWNKNLYQAINSIQSSIWIRRLLKVFLLNTGLITKLIYISVTLLKICFGSFLTPLPFIGVHENQN